VIIDPAVAPRSRKRFELRSVQSGWTKGCKRPSLTDQPSHAATLCASSTDESGDLHELRTCRQVNQPGS
jgi:hypothetical protein